ncbi:MAG: hypothetical protein QG594_2312, partial [Bacteroidota bacterium]|nr:hypothetical protein [Bacteroidota bacterium]
MAEKLKKVDSNPTMKVIKNDEETAFDIFGDAKPKEKAKSAKLDKEVVEAEGYEAKLLVRQELKEQIDELGALKKSVDDEIRVLGREKFVEICNKI